MTTTDGDGAWEGVDEVVGARPGDKPQDRSEIATVDGVGDVTRNENGAHDAGRGDGQHAPAGVEQCRPPAALSGRHQRQVADQYAQASHHHGDDRAEEKERGEVRRAIHRELVVAGQLYGEED